MTQLLDIGARETEVVTNQALVSFHQIINIVLPIILGVVLLVGTVYAIILGVNYSKAEDADKRKEAKDRLVGAVVGFLITLVLVAVIYACLHFFIPNGKTKTSDPFTSDQFKQETIITINKEKVNADADDSTATMKGYTIKIGSFEKTISCDASKTQITLADLVASGQTSFKATINNAQCTFTAFEMTIKIENGKTTFTINATYTESGKSDRKIKNVEIVASDKISVKGTSANAWIFDNKYIAA